MGRYEITINNNIIKNTVESRKFYVLGIEILFRSIKGSN